MTVKEQISHGVIQKICHLHNGIFHSIGLKENILWNERKEDFLYIWLLQRITLYQRR